MPDDFDLWTSALLVSCPLPFSFPGTFLKTLPQTEIESKSLYASITPRLFVSLASWTDQYSQFLFFFDQSSVHELLEDNVKINS